QKTSDSIESRKKSFFFQISSTIFRADLHLLHRQGAPENLPFNRLLNFVFRPSRDVRSLLRQDVSVKEIRGQLTQFREIGLLLLTPYIVFFVIRFFSA
ncbi:MAG: hypothetical protein V1798_01690, partial [Pseudomonadota bacterium]